jgi:hypothetical protein
VPGSWSNPHRTVRCGHSRQLIAAYNGPMRVSELPQCRHRRGSSSAECGECMHTRLSDAQNRLPNPAATPLSQSVLAPPPPPRDPPVIPILHPPKRGHEIHRPEQRPAPAKLPQHPADPRRPLKLPPTRLHRPRRPIHLCMSQPQRLDQAGLLVRPHSYVAPPIMPLDPTCQTRTELALTVVHQRQPAARHRPKLH